MKLLLILSIDAFFVITIFCFPCWPNSPPPIAFCRSDWIAIIKVISKNQTSPCEARNKIEYVKIYKAPPELNNGTLPHEIDTHGGGYCLIPDLLDPTLEPDHEYLLNGGLRDWGMIISSCDKIENEEDIKIIMERHLYKLCDKILKCHSPTLLHGVNWQHPDFNFEEYIERCGWPLSPPPPPPPRHAPPSMSKT